MEVKMTNKRNWLGISVILLIFGVCVLGCATKDSTGSRFNFYNFGDVSEENCAYILVSPVRESDGNVWPFRNTVKINGQGDSTLWARSSGSFNDRQGRAIVRLTPGEHTFTLSFFRSTTRVNLNTLSDVTNEREIPVDIKFNVQAGKGYIFYFGSFRTGPTPTDPTRVVIIVEEFDSFDDGNFGNLGSFMRGNIGREIARHTQLFYVTSADMR
jgi:hypothetical protein